MSRELERRLVALERTTSSGQTRYVVCDRLPEEERDGPELIAPMTEAEWLDAYGVGMNLAPSHLVAADTR
jgi:hypothetical protein